MENLSLGFALGLLTWFTTWGFNRVYLMFKGLFS